MDCPSKTQRGAELLIDYVSRALTPAAEAAFEDHLSVCEWCRRTVVAQKAMWSALDAWCPESASPDFDQRLHARISAEMSRPWYRRALDFEWSWRPLMPVAAACLALAGVFLIRQPVLELRPAAAPQVRQVDIEQVERALDDLEMLNQLGVVPASGDQAARRPS